MPTRPTPLASVPRIAYWTTRPRQSRLRTSRHACRSLSAWLNWHSPQGGSDDGSDVVPPESARNPSGVTPGLLLPHGLAEATPRGLFRRAPCSDHRKRAVLFLPRRTVRVRRAEIGRAHV